jgi:hypothetical protein
MVLPPSLKVLAQEPVQLDRTIHDPGLMDYILLPPSSPLLSVDVANVIIQAILPLRRPATATSVLFSSGAGPAVPPLGKYLANIYLQRGPPECEHSVAAEVCRRSVHALLKAFTASHLA